MSKNKKISEEQWKKKKKKKKMEMINLIREKNMVDRIKQIQWEVNSFTI